MPRWLPYLSVLLVAFLAGMWVLWPPNRTDATGGDLKLVIGEPTVAVPSGQKIKLLDVIRGEDSALGKAVRYRFVAPGIGRESGQVAFSDAEADMQTLCRDYVLPRIVSQNEEMPKQIIIVLADRPVEFGVADPDATQFFEAYRPEGGTCIWEGF